MLRAEEGLSCPRLPLYKTLSAPIDVQLEITTACDNACIHCYNSWQIESPSSLRAEQVSCIISELARNGVFYVTLTGGEPLLLDRTVVATIEEASAQNLCCSLNSNLTQLTQEVAIGLKAAGLFSILVSLCSFDETTHDRITQRSGSFQETISGIRIAKDVGFPFAINMVVSRLNKNHVYETGRLAIRLGAETFCATRASPPLGEACFSLLELTPEETKEMLDDLLRLQGEFGLRVDTLEPYPHCFFQNVSRFAVFARRKCQAALTTCTIGPDGSVRPCSHSDRIYGNIFRKPLGDIWLQMQEWRSGALIPTLCQNCSSFTSCGAGCRTAAQFQGNIAGLDPLTTSPEAVIPIKRTLSQISDDFFRRTFVVNPRLRFRPEEFGGVIDAGVNQPIFVNERAFAILRELNNQGGVSIENLCQRFGFEREEAAIFFFHLLDQRVVLEIN